MNKKAFIFPGQGSQETKMGLDLYENFDSAKKIFNALNETLGFSLTDIMWKSSTDELTKTQNAQPAIVAVSYAAFKALEDAGIKPDAVAGHSIGEYSALTCSGVISFEDAVRLVRKRGLLMQECSEKHFGSMAAVMGLEEDKIEEVLSGLRNDGIIEVANINSDNQIVISGESRLIDEALEPLKAKGAKRAVKLNVAGAFHSPLMKDANVKLAEEIDKIKFSDPVCPVYVNVTAQKMTDFNEIKKVLKKQIISKVQWNKLIKNMVSDGINEFVEAGNGSVLSGLVKRIAPSGLCCQMNSRESFEKIKNIYSGSRICS